MKPFVKWVGGKRQLYSEIKNRMPKEYKTYYEPFVGGGAILFMLEPKNAIIGDGNKDLISAYNSIKTDLEKLVPVLDTMQELHALNPSDFYAFMRGLDRRDNYEKICDFDRAIRFLYLNKTCFNGLYRVNSKNQNNVPWNKKENIILYDKENLHQVSKYFNQNNITILHDDFEKVVCTAQRGDFIYFDPPYDVLTKTTFDSYSKDGFGREGQERLAKVFFELHSRGCFVMLSNHNTEFIRELYRHNEITIDIVHATRKVNSNASGRGLVEEVLIYNYELED